MINPNGFWTSKVWKIHFTPTSWETRIDFWVYSPICQHYPSHLGMVLQQLFRAQSFQGFLGSQGKNEVSWGGYDLSKLNPGKGKSQSMAGLAALVVMLFNSLEEIWRTAPEHQTAWPKPLSQSKQLWHLAWSPCQGTTRQHKLPTARALCLQGITADLVVPVTGLPSCLGASP